VKLLFDQNLSHKLVRHLADLFPDSIHVRDVGLKAAGDPLVWGYARDNDLMIVSKIQTFIREASCMDFRQKLCG
jgi:predicted nuclease of predicted toxin-antitoxin system